MVVVPWVCLLQSVVVSHLRYLNKLGVCKFTRNKAGGVLAPSYSYMYSLRKGAPDKAKSATACIVSLCIACEIILADFNLAVSTSTAKLPNCQI